MKLKTYLKKQNETPYRFAKRIGENHVTIWRIVNEKNEPRIDLALKIIGCTGGAVGFSDLSKPRNGKAA